MTMEAITPKQRAERGEITANVALDLYEEENAQLRACLGAALQDADRLDWLERHPLRAEVHGGSDDGHTGTFWGLGAHSGTLREAIDHLRRTLIY